MQDQPPLDCQGGEMSVCGQIARSSKLQEKRLQDREVLGRRLHQHKVGKIEPFFDDSESFLNRERIQ